MVLLMEVAKSGWMKFAAVGMNPDSLIVLPGLWGCIIVTMVRMLV